MASLYVFGSVARGEADEASDVDILLDIAPEASFNIIDWAGLQIDLQDRLGRPTDVHLRNSLHYWIRDEVLADAVKVF